MEELEVLISGESAGILTQMGDGRLSFRYGRRYRGAPLSSTMPLSTSTYGDGDVRPYLSCLLPDSEDARRAVAREHHVSSDNPFAMLRVIGLDCPGAVQFRARGFEAARESRLVRQSDRDIARRLSKGKEREAGWISGGERWSLAGQQAKFALRKKDGAWFSCEGDEPTTHIFKSGVSHLQSQALDEYVCMCLAKRCGIPTAGVSYEEFEGDDGLEPAIVVERYDRSVNGGEVARIHQEDMCQALGLPPTKKYTFEGGPSSVAVMRRVSDFPRAGRGNAARFLQMLFFNYLIVGHDAHARNYSIMLRSDGAHSLAPMYDVASGIPYVDPREIEVKPPKLAMSIGGENRPGRVSLKNLEKFVRSCSLERFGIRAEGCANLISSYADVIPGELAKIFDELETMACADAARELRSRMEAPLERLCERSKNNL